MKRFLLLLLTFSSTIVMAQTTWTGLGANTNWNNTDNWDTNLVPTASDDVIIPTGFTVTLNVAGNVKSIDLQGNSVLDMNTNFTFGESSTFGANATVNWNVGSLTGTATTLTNNGTVNINTGNVTLIASTTLLNLGEINFNGSGDIFVGVDAVLNNTSSGTISFLADGARITETGTGTNLLINEGLIVVELPNASNDITINTEIQNNDGTIQVNSGVLNLANATLGSQVLTDGTYNIAVDGTFEWDSAVTLEGILTGNIQGALNSRGTIVVNPLTPASLSFTGNQTLSWLSGTISGGGNLTNNGIMRIVTSNVTLAASTTVTNVGYFNLAGSGDLFISIDAELNNTVSGTISFLDDGGRITETGSGTNLLSNSGTILVNLPNIDDEVIISTELLNNNGVFQIDSGVLNLSNATLGSQILTDGTYNITANGTFDWDSAITLEGTLTGDIQGVLNSRSTITVNPLTPATLSFTGNQTLNWLSGTISGEGVLTNNSVIRTLTGNVTLAVLTTLSNSGQINLSGSGDIFIAADAELNNTMSGTLSMLGDGGNISETGSGTNLFTNLGLVIVNLPDVSDSVIISTELHNNNGTIQVDTGTLNLSNAAIGAQLLTNGTYNIATNGTMDWDSTITLNGSLSGTIDGQINWRGTTRVESGELAEFNFEPSSIVTWASGTLNGGGTLTNNATIELITGNVTMNDASLLINNSEMNFTSTGDVFVGTGSELRNGSTGVIDFQNSGTGIAESGGGINLFNNQGLLLNTSGATINISAESQNSGTIEATTGTLNFSNSLNNQIGGVFTGIGTIDIPIAANFTNDGNVSPGLSPGTLTILGDYLSTANSILEMELNGLTPDTEHDVLAISGNNVVFEGVVDVTLGFAPSIGDTFTIATVTGTITTGNLVSPIYAEFDCLQYTFDVSYPGNNSVVLTVSAEEDVHDPVVITQDITVQLDASGNVSITPNDIDNGSSDNCGIDSMSLDISDFNCSDLGENTVALTVIDINGNSASNTAIVTVEDTVLPSVVTQDITIQLDVSGNASITAGQIDNGSTDNCMVASLVLDITSFTCSDLGVNTVELTVIDQSGNSNSGFATVTVEDTTSPTVVTQDITVQLDGFGMVSISENDIDNGSTDNCSIASLSLDVTDFTCANLGENMVSLTVVDQSGNSSSASATVTVEDVTNPTVLTQNILVQLDATGNASVTPNDIDNGSTDNCSIVSLSLDVTDFTCANMGDNTVNLTVTDSSGNSASEIATVTVVDNIDPIINCPVGFNIGISEDYILPDYVAQGDVTVSDNCGFTVTQTPVAGTNLPVGEYEISLVITDDSGNTASCSFDLKLTDNTLGINNYDFSENTIVLFPNPVQNVLTIKNNSEVNLKQLDIYDITGKWINRIDLDSIDDEIKIPMDQYASGVYFVRIKTHNSSVTKRFIKQ